MREQTVCLGQTGPGRKSVGPYGVRSWAKDTVNFNMKAKAMGWKAPGGQRPRTANFKSIFGPRLEGEAQTFLREVYKEQLFEPRLQTPSSYRPTSQKPAQIQKSQPSR